MPLVFLTPYKKTYSSEYCSLSTLLGFIFLLISILLPFFAGISSEDFWLRLKEYMEQPIIEFTENKDYMLYITTYNDNNQTHNYFYSSNDTLRNRFSNICNLDINAQCSLENNRLSFNFKDDNLIITYEANERVTEATNKDIKLIVFLKYYLTKKVKLIMTPMIYINIPILTSGNRIITLNGDLELVQKSPIPMTSVTSQIYNYDDNKEKKKPLDVDGKLFSEFDFSYFFEKYKNLNYSLKYNYEKIEQNGGDNLHIEIRMKIPKLQRIFYIESVYEAIKYAWMQYFYIFLPIYILLYMTYKYIIENNIFYSHAKEDL